MVRVPIILHMPNLSGTSSACWQLDKISRGKQEQVIDAAHCQAITFHQFGRWYLEFPHCRDFSIASSNCGKHPFNIKHLQTTHHVSSTRNPCNYLPLMGIHLWGIQGCSDWMLTQGRSAWDKAKVCALISGGALMRAFNQENAKLNNECLPVWIETLHLRM